MNRNPLSKDLDNMLKRVKELEAKHNVRMRKLYESITEAKIEAIIDEAMESRLKHEKTN